MLASRDASPKTFRWSLRQRLNDLAKISAALRAGQGAPTAAKRRALYFARNAPPAILSVRALSQPMALAISSEPKPNEIL